MKTITESRNEELQKVMNGMQQLLIACGVDNASFSRVYAEDMDSCDSCCSCGDGCTGAGCDKAQAKKWDAMGLNGKSEVIEFSLDILPGYSTARLFDVTDLPALAIVETILGNIRDTMQDNEKRALTSRLKMIESNERQKMSL